MKKITFYKWAFYLFLLSNVLLIAFIVVKKERHREPKEIIIERLHFSPKQIERYEQEIRKHRQAIRRIERQQIHLKQQLYSNLDQPTDTVALNKLSANYRKIQLINITHFKAIQFICTKSQMLAFKKLQHDLPHLFTPRPPKK